MGLEATVAGPKVAMVATQEVMEATLEATQEATVETLEAMEATLEAMEEETEAEMLEETLEEMEAETLDAVVSDLRMLEVEMTETHVQCSWEVLTISSMTETFQTI